MDTFLNKVLIKSAENEDATTEQKKFLYMDSKWTNEGLFLNMHNSISNNTYTAEITADVFGSSATELGKPFEDFYLECKEALTANIRLQPFEYHIDEEKLKFHLIKNDSKFTIVYLEIPLKKIHSNCVLLDNAINVINELRQAKSDELKNVQKDDTTTKQLLAELTKCKREKDEIEQKLFRKFLILLNSKKDIISKYKEELQKNNANNDVVTTEDDIEINEADCDAAADDDDDDFDASTEVDDD